MLLTQEQISAANKANLETLAQLSRKAFDGVEKLMELNLQVAKTLMQENVEHLQDTSKAKDIKDYFAALSNHSLKKPFPIADIYIPLQMKRKQI